MQKPFRKLATIGIALAVGTSMLTSEPIAFADGWDFVYGESTPYDYSAFLSTAVNESGGTFLFGQYAGTFEGLDAGAQYQFFVQYRNSSGALQWTKNLVENYVGCSYDLDIAADAGDDGNAYFIAAGCFDDDLGSWGFRGSVTPTGVITTETVGIDDGVQYDSLSDNNLLSKSLVLAEGGGLLSLNASQGMGPNSLYVESATVTKRDADLTVEWSVELPSDLLSSGSVSLDSSSLAASSDGGAWFTTSIPKPLPHMQDALALVQISSMGEIVKTVRHNGFTCYEPLVVRQTTESIWIDGCRNASGYEGLGIDSAMLPALDSMNDVWSFSSSDGRSLGRVPGFSGLDNPVLRPRVAIPDSLFDCGTEHLSFGLNYPNEDCIGYRYVRSGDFSEGFASFANGGKTMTAVLETSLSGQNTYLGVWSISGDGSNTKFTPVYSTKLPDNTNVGDVDVVADSLLTVGSTTSGDVPALRSPISAQSGGTRAFATTTYIRALRDRCAQLRNVTARVGAESDGFNALAAPIRPLDTRSEGPIGHLIEGDDGSCSINVRSISGIPASASAVAMNVTVVNGQANEYGGFVSVYPCGTVPDVSNINFTTGQTVANSVIAPISDNGEICFYVYGQANLLADISGYFTAGFEPMTPRRLMDTRSNTPVGADDLGGTGTPYALDVSSAAPASASAVAMNVTVVNGQANEYGGFVSVYPCGTVPDVSNINFTTGQTVANSVIAPISDNGEICFYVYGQANLLADISGYFTAGFEPMTPRRLMDTRSNTPVGADDLGGTGTPYALDVSSAAPASASAVAMNVTVVNGQANEYGGFVSVYPCGTVPDVSNINFTTGQTVANSVIAPISDNGEICFYVYGQANLLADISGYLTE